MQHNFRQKRANVRQEGFCTLLKVIDCFAHWRKLFNSFLNLFMQQSAQNVLADEQETEQSFVQQQSHLELFQKPQAKRKKSLVSNETLKNTRQTSKLNYQSKDVQQKLWKRT